MTSAFDAEFATIDLLLECKFETRAVDAFCLSWIKYERQLRKLAAFLLYQSSQLNSSDSANLRQAFLENTGIGHTDTRSAIFRLSGFSPAEMFDGHYKRLKTSLDHAYRARQKLFHGQQSGDALSREDLISRIAVIRDWCGRLSDGCEREFGYDGFSRGGSLRKSGKQALIERVDFALGGRSWKEFVSRL